MPLTSQQKEGLKKRARNYFRPYEARDDQNQQAKFKIRRLMCELYEAALDSDEIKDIHLATRALDLLFDAKNCLVEAVFYPEEPQSETLATPYVKTEDA